MKMPSKSDYAKNDLGGFIHAMNQWGAASEAAYQFLRGLYEATPETEGYPAWVENATHVKTVSMDHHPSKSDIEPVLRNLAGAVMNDGCKIVRISHGLVTRDDKQYWGCWAETAPV